MSELTASCLSGWHAEGAPRSPAGTGFGGDLALVRGWDCYSQVDYLVHGFSGSGPVLLSKGFLTVVV